MTKSSRNKILTILLFVQIAIVYFLSKFPDIIERFYTNGIYIGISSFLRTLFGWIPFSVGDIIYTSLIVLIIRFLILFIKNKKSNRIALIYQLVRRIFYLLFLFLFFLGLELFKKTNHQYT